jgi:phospholipase/carboxylesterase
MRDVMTYLPCVERLSGLAENGSNSVEPVASVIWLHGLGASGDDFAPVVEAMALPESYPVRFIFPHAPSIPVTVNQGYVMPAWYDILEMGAQRKVNTDQLLVSAEKIQALIDREITRGVSSECILLVGFSQGGAVAYQAALSCSKPLGGLFALSTYFATTNDIVCHELNRNISISIQHGSQDNVVHETLGKKAFSDLQVMGYKPTYKTFPIEHTVCLEQINEIKLFLLSLIDAK